MSKAWDKYKQTLSGLSPEDEAILRPEYDNYIISFTRYAGAITVRSLTVPLSFSDWWRAKADYIKDNREGK